MAIINTSIDIFKKTVRDNDYLWAKISRAPAAFFLACIQKLKITPNQITFINFAFGMAGIAYMAFYPGQSGLWIAWILLQLAFIIDCMDGMQARYKNLLSPVGLKLDFLIDETKVFFLFPAVGYRLYMEQDNVMFLLITLVGGAFIAGGFCMTYLMRSPEYTGEQSHGKRGTHKGLIGKVMQFFSFLLNYPSWLLIPVIFNRMDIFLYISLAVYVLYFGYALLKIMRKLGSYSHYNI